MDSAMEIQWKNLKHLPFLVTLTIIQFLLHADAKQPHIIFIIADDLGWNDVGFHGSNQIPTPNIDSLAYSGVILNKYYVNPICTPSRSALMTGKYPIHTGMQHTVLYAAEPRGLPLKEKLLPEYLRDLGYSNHIVGKWHLGHYKKEYTPLHRGFDSHVGFWTGRHDYFDHTSVENQWWGLDMRNAMEPGFEFHGQYSTDIFTNEAVKVIKSHNSTKPLFLYLAHAAVHSGNPYNPLPAPEDVVAKFGYIDNYSRRRFAAMVSKLDDSVGEVVKALSSSNMLEDSIIVFTSDNGGPAEGFNLNYASNWPLKGVKNTLWEGGVRGAALIWSKSLEKRRRVSEQMMHITDWLPTLYTAAGGNSTDILTGLDAIDMWDILSKNEESNRKEILHNIDDIYGSASLTSGNWKIHKGTNYDGDYDKWYGPSGREGEYNMSLIFSSNSGNALTSIKEIPEAQEIIKLRKEATVKCNSSRVDNCHPLKRPCLFNIRDDPCEHKNLANMAHYKSILNELLALLDKYNSTAVPPSNLPMDEKANPKYWNYTWTNFGDTPYIIKFNYML